MKELDCPIKAAYEDVEENLVRADWFEEHGDHDTAIFIRSRAARMAALRKLNPKLGDLVTFKRMMDTSLEHEDTGYIIEVLISWLIVKPLGKDFTLTTSPTEVVSILGGAP